MSDKIQWPMPAPRDGRRWELWHSNHFVLFATVSIGSSDVELTPEVWEELPSKVQEGLFKLSLLEHGAKLKGVGRVPGNNHIRMDYDDADTVSDNNLYQRLKNKYAKRE